MTQDLSSLISELNALFQAGQGQIFTLHKNPFEEGFGGVESVVKRKFEEASKNSRPAMILFPSGEGLRATLLKKNSLIHTNLDKSNSLKFISHLSKWFSNLEVHHILNWNHSLLTKLLEIPFQKKIFFTHDFYSVCPSINLVHGFKKRFCALAESKASCSACYQAFYRMHFATLGDYRKQMEQLLRQFDEIHFPSEFTRSLFQKVYPLPQLKIVVEPINLKYIGRKSAQGSQEDNKKVIFMGAFSNLKGAKIFRDSVPQLQALGYAPEIWGELVPGQAPMPIPVRPYRSIEELATRFKTENPIFALFPAITGETFSLTFHETILLSECLPIVSPYGHPATLVRESEYGLVLSALSPAGVIQAIQLASVKRQELLKNHGKAIEIIKKPKPGKIQNGTKLQNPAVKAPEPGLGEPKVWTPPQFSHRLKRHLNYVLLFPVKLLMEKTNAAER